MYEEWPFGLYFDFGFGFDFDFDFLL